ncbi:MAG: hypothetical protein ACI8UO_003090 [Verrucomicrobiales bacterium]|jgi:hypothetical protein
MKIGVFFVSLLSAFSALAQAESLIPERAFFPLEPGPWGEIEAQLVKLAPTISLIEKVSEGAARDNAWAFAEPTIELVAQRLRTANLSETLIQQLLGPEHARFDVEKGLWFVVPTAEAILALSPIQRAQLYAPMRALPTWSDASYVRNPLPIENSDPARWFSGVGLSQQTIDLATRLCYQQGRTTVLSDVDFIASQIADEKEKIAFLRAAEQTEAVVLRLRLTPQSNIRALANYWSNPETESTVRAMLEALQPQSGERWIDIAQLLPPMPRSRLYSFTQPADVSVSLPDCRWTALNFFANQPSSRLADESTAFQALESNYDPVPPPFRFGDVIVIFEKETGKFIHSCVYIADSIVFTKNGNSSLNPWTLQRDDRLSRLYVRDRVIEMKVMRRRQKDS